MERIEEALTILAWCIAIPTSIWLSFSVVDHIYKMATTAKFFISFVECKIWIVCFVCWSWIWAGK